MFGLRLRTRVCNIFHDVPFAFRCFESPFSPAQGTSRFCCDVGISVYIGVVDHLAFSAYCSVCRWLQALMIVGSSALLLNTVEGGVIEYAHFGVYQLCLPMPTMLLL